jgi:L-ascorbate metabolism protein UlaG (beta-lactamase superfamily)
MELFWLGHGCFRLRSRDATIIADPCPRSTGYSIGKQSADIVTISHNHDSHNYLDAVTGEPKVITGPGEYEVSGVLLTGVRTYHDAQKGARKGKNTAFLIETEDVRICHLGDIGHILTPEQAEALSSTDVLLLPVGGGATIDAVAAAEVVSLLEPKVVVPMHYQTDVSTENLDPLDRFLKEMSLGEVTPQPKLAVTKSGLPSDTQVVVLDYRK